MLVAYRDAQRRISPGTRRPVRTRGGTLVLRKKAILGGLAAALLGMSAGSPHVVAAFGATRTISMHHIHTGESITITYKKDGKYDPEALKKLNWFLRDWRENKATEMDPKTIDLLWEMHTELGSKVPIDIICGFRSEKTNSMLRRTVGGQAKQSQHITGKAIDATFPDVPLKQMRYSALIRERGGVGYYPTSGVPFVHVDTGNVRAWPRVTRSELALLFPSGRTQHKPADGDSISQDDVRRARANTEVAAQVAAFFALRNHPRSEVEIAEAEAGAAVPAPVLKSAPTQVARPAPEVRLAELEADAPAAAALAPPPRLVQAPHLATPPPSDAERGQLNQLVTLASLDTSEIPARPQPADADRRGLDALVSTASLEAPGTAPPAAKAMPPAPARLASLEPAAPAATAKAPVTGAQPAEWAPAAEFDEDHPEELSYRPFPIAPLLTQSASADDEALVKIVHPNLARTLDLLDDKQIVLPMRLRPGGQIAQVMWAQQFQGNAVDFSQPPGDDAGAKSPSGLTSRAVKTTAR
jgi:uncharacterized protein YcbK (DUF882 family)